MSVRELENDLTAWLRRVEAGERVLVARGDEIVAAIVPVAELRDLDEAVRLLQLAARGLVQLPEGWAATERPRFHGPRVPERGRPASAMVRDDRR